MDTNAAMQTEKLTPVLQAVGLTKAFAGVQALSGVDLTIYPGEIHALLGENGAGKSTLLKTLFGVQQPDAGSIRVDGGEVTFRQPSDAMAHGIAMVHQELSLIPQLSATQNIVLGREPGRGGLIDWAAAATAAAQSLARLGFEADPNRPVSELSVAHGQLVELARALSVNAKTIILDEPTASLTTRESERLFTVLRQLRAEGHALVYVSHRLKEVLDLSDRVTVLRDGKLVGVRTRDQITDEDDLVKLMVGRNLSALGIAPDGTASDEVALKVEGLRVHGSDHTVNLTVRCGEVVGLSGMVGAGRTELARAIIGADKRDSGEVWVDGERKRIRSPLDAIKAGIAFLPEDRKGQGLELDMSTASNTTLIKPPSRWAILRRGEQVKTATRLLQSLNARVNVRAPVRTLSGGTQQKVVLARWLITNSSVFIFDEPTRGIDVGAKGEIHALMRQLAEDGKGILMISSDLPEVLAMSDRVLVMRRGEVVADLLRAQATEEAVVAQAAGD